MPERRSPSGGRGNRRGRPAPDPAAPPVGEAPQYVVSPDLPARVQYLLDAQRLRAQPFTREQVFTTWKKAVDSLGDARLAGISLDGALQAANTAALVGCHAVLAAHGLRPAGDRGHHEVTFAAVAGLGLPGLGDLVPDSEEARALRRGSIYDPALASEADRATAIAWASRVLPHLRRALVAHDAALAPILRDVSA